MLRVAVGELIVRTASRKYCGSGAENSCRLRLYQQTAIRHNIRVTKKSVKFFYGVCRLVHVTCLGEVMKGKLY